MQKKLMTFLLRRCLLHEERNKRNSTQVETFVVLSAAKAAVEGLKGRIFLNAIPFIIESAFFTAIVTTT